MAPQQIQVRTRSFGKDLRLSRLVWNKSHNKHSVACGIKNILFPNRPVLLFLNAERSRRRGESEARGYLSSRRLLERGRHVNEQAELVFAR